MHRSVRTRFWWESGLAVVTGVLAVVTSFRHDWLEAVGFDPDHGNGSFEWGAVLVLALVCVVSVLVARMEWARTRTA
jgi:hypothetical protein